MYGDQREQEEKNGKTYVIVENAVLVTVSIEVSKRIVGGKVLELNEQIREHVRHGVHELVHECVHLTWGQNDSIRGFGRTDLLTRRSETTNANIKRIIEVPLGIGSEIEADGHLRTSHSTWHVTHCTTQTYRRSGLDARAGNVEIPSAIRSVSWRRTRAPPHVQFSDADGQPVCTEIAETEDARAWQRMRLCLSTRHRPTHRR